MHLLSRLGRENIEYKEEDPPVTDFYTESEILDMFDGYSVEETANEHYRALPIARSGLKANLYNMAFKPVYNLVHLRQLRILEARRKGDCHGPDTGGDQPGGPAFRDRRGPGREHSR